jgi:hypothetical protein
MKTLLSTAAFLPALVLAHGNHAQTSNDAAHGFLHAAMSLEGAAIVAALSAVVYFIFIKK